MLEEVIAFAPRCWQARVLITAGRTFEAIDPVRGITNHSSGKMGFAIARAARESGCRRHAGGGPVHLPTPRGVRRLDVKSAQNMPEPLREAQGATLFIATAAVADWRPARQSTKKSRRMARASPGEMDFVENPDILARVAASPAPSPGRCTVWALLLKATICWPTPGQAFAQGRAAAGGQHWPRHFGQDDNALLLVDEQGHRELPHASKRALAQQLVAEIARRLPR